MLQSESLSMIPLPDFSIPEKNVISLPCWQDICLSKIWIPSHLLTNRKNPSSSFATQGVFHTLEKRGDAKQIESFSTYSESDNESELDIFQSDSDDTFDLDSISNDTEEIKEGSKEVSEKIENLFKLKSNVSLNEILNSTIEADITNFEFKKNHKHAIEQGEPSQSNKKCKNAKKKNKVVKSVTLDKFLEDYTEQDKQESCANDYLRKVLRAKNKGDNEDGVQLRNDFEFPDLMSNEIEFMHYEKSRTAEPEITIKTGTQILSDKNENDTNNQVEKISSIAPETVIGKIVIENIPSDVSHEDIFTLLCGYGEVKDFTLKPDGDFFKALVKIDLICDIDWITECLNGTEPFGTSTRVLKCYKI